MKRWSHISQFAIVCAAIVVGAWSGVLLCDWLDPIPEEEALLVEKAHERVRESKSSPAIAEAARPTRSSRGVRGKGWIADVWSGPRRTGAFRVAGVSADGRVEAQCVDDGALDIHTYCNKRLLREDHVTALRILLRNQWADIAVHGRWIEAVVNGELEPAKAIAQTHKEMMKYYVKDEF